MAQKLHDTYNFSYDQLRVLLGGWPAWRQAGYPGEQGDPLIASPTPEAPTPVQP